jgi:hypothetical protein
VVSREWIDAYQKTIRSAKGATIAGTGHHPESKHEYALSRAVNEYLS